MTPSPILPPNFTLTSAAENVLGIKSYDLLSEERERAKRRVFDVIFYPFTVQ